MVPRMACQLLGFCAVLAASIPLATASPSAAPSSEPIPVSVWVLPWDNAQASVASDGAELLIASLNRHGRFWIVDTTESASKTQSRPLDAYHCLFRSQCLAEVVKRLKVEWLVHCQVSRNTETGELRVATALYHAGQRAVTFLEPREAAANAPALTDLWQQLGQELEPQMVGATAP